MDEDRSSWARFRIPVVPKPNKQGPDLHFVSRPRTVMPRKKRICFRGVKLLTALIVMLIRKSMSRKEPLLLLLLFLKGREVGGGSGGWGWGSGGGWRGAVHPIALA